jgi:hypothetical protein
VAKIGTSNQDRTISLKAAVCSCINNKQHPVIAISPEMLQQGDAIICEDQCIKTQQLALKSFNLQGKY